MMIVKQMLIVAGSSIFLVLGSLHLFYTFFSGKFDPRNPAATEAMKKTSMRLTKDTSVWNAWIGFHGSHSSGAMYFGLINIILAVYFFDSVGSSVLLGLVNLATIGFYLFLARKYWFKIPFRGILIAMVLFLAAFTLRFIK